MCYHIIIITKPTSHVEPVPLISFIVFAIIRIWIKKSTPINKLFPNQRVCCRISRRPTRVHISLISTRDDIGENHKEAGSISNHVEMWEHFNQVNINAARFYQREFEEKNQSIQQQKIHSIIFLLNLHLPLSSKSHISSCKDKKTTQ